MTSATRVGILGGTFDPVHLGHIETARAARVALGLDRVLVLPSGTPPHRQPPAVSRYHRFAMTALAVAGIDGLELSDLEIGQAAASYTFETLARLHDYGLLPSQIFFITGADAFAEIATWSRYPQVLDMAHFIVVSRPGHRASDLPRVLPSLADRMTTAAGWVDDGRNSRVFLVDTATPDVSSTVIRHRVSAGESILGLVPEPVAVYIDQHGLYTRDGARAFGRSLA